MGVWRAGGWCGGRSKRRKVVGIEKDGVGGASHGETQVQRGQVASPARNAGAWAHNPGQVLSTRPRRVTWGRGKRSLASGVKAYWGLVTGKSRRSLRVTPSWASRRFCKQQKLGETPLTPNLGWRGVGASLGTGAEGLTPCIRRGDQARGWEVSSPLEGWVWQL